MHGEHCDCKPLVCGHHLIKPCAVSTLKQVRSQVTTDELLFLVLGAGIHDDNVFLTSRQVQPLLDYWGIEGDDIQPLGERTGKTYFRKRLRKRRVRQDPEDAQ